MQYFLPPHNASEDSININGIYELNLNAFSTFLYYGQKRST